MDNKIKITVVYDNNPFGKDKDLETDWGFACIIEKENDKILFDTGDNGEILLRNMNKLGFDPKSINVVFLSHFHHDHTGGLKEFLKVNSNVKVFYPQSFPKEIIDIIENSCVAEAIPILSFTEILPDIFTLGEIPGKIPEQSLVLRMTNELIVITGCAHPGIVNILQKAKDKFPEELIYLTLGGFHLHRLSEDEINEVIHKMFGMEILNIAATHCTGINARNMYKEVFDADYIETGVGQVFCIG